MRLIFTALLGIAALILCASYLAEHLFHLDSCKLCKIQRIPYFLVAAGALLGIYTQYRILILRLLQAILVIGCLIASYHAAVTFGWVSDPCIVKPDLDSIESFRTALMQPMPCSVSAWRLFTIPIPVFNTFLSMTLALVIQIHIGKKKKNLLYLALSTAKCNKRIKK
jgi:disulfide bond formation protein DsbB